MTSKLDFSAHQLDLLLDAATDVAVSQERQRMRTAIVEQMERCGATSYGRGQMRVLRRLLDHVGPISVAVAGQ